MVAGTLRYTTLKGRYSIQTGQERNESARMDGGPGNDPPLLMQPEMQPELVLHYDLFTKKKALHYSDKSRRRR